MQAISELIPTDAFDRCIATHCAATLLGAKPANLFAVSSDQKIGIGRYLYNMIRQLPDQVPGRYAFICLADHGDHAHYLFYRPADLARFLEQEQCRGILDSLGYRLDVPLKSILLQLRKRWKHSAETPHEIGLFLGYPPHDVAAFMRDGGRAARFGGYWQVYEDEETARQTFKRYDECRFLLLMGLTKGSGLLNVLGEACMPAQRPQSTVQCPA